MKILIIRFSSIGDIVLTTPVIRCLRKQFPEAEIHYLTKSANAQLLLHNPYLTKLHLLKESLQEVNKVLAKERFHYVVDLHNNLRSLLVKTRLGRSSFSFNKLNAEKWMLVNLKVNRLPQQHIVDRYMETVEMLGVKNDGEGLDYFFPPEGPPSLDFLPESFKRGFHAFVIGAGHETKKLPKEKILALCERIEYPVVLVGGKQEEAAGAWLQEQLPEKILSVCGQLSLHESAAVVRQAEKIISHDTGYMHIAAAFFKPILSIWGNTVPEFGMYPYYPGGSALQEQQMMAEVNGLGCRPCSKIGFSRCPKGHFKCMREQDVGEMANWVNR
ncbi:MAG: glycosyltransferase family 9 protein [Bacteroidia bacterium]